MEVNKLFERHPKAFRVVFSPDESAAVWERAWQAWRPGVDLTVQLGEVAVALAKVRSGIEFNAFPDAHDEAYPNTPWSVIGAADAQLEDLFRVAREHDALKRELVKCPRIKLLEDGDWSAWAFFPRRFVDGRQMYDPQGVDLQAATIVVARLPVQR